MGLGGIMTGFSMPHFGQEASHSAQAPGFAAPGRVCDGVVMAWIELDGAVNVRDLGDMPTEDGQKTARASLLRADSLQDL